jgi:RsiW-degrading membrane proteinase PrsW (M82 family)
LGVLVSMAEQVSLTIPIHRPKAREKVFFLLSGVVVSIPLTSFINTFSDVLVSFMPEVYAGIFSVVLLAPIIEEFSKAYPLFYRHAETERSIFTLGFLVGLGFGIAEMIEYVVLLQYPILLRLPGVFFHASTTSIIAFGIGRKRPVPYYLIAVVLHLSNNLFAALWPFYLLGGPFIIGLTYFLSWFFYGKTRERMIPI